MPNIIGFLYIVGINIINFFVIAFTLFFTSKSLNFKRNKISLAFLVASIFTIISLNLYFIRSFFIKPFLDISLSFTLTLILLSGVIQVFTLIFSIKFIYKVKWGRALISFLILFGIWVVIGAIIGVSTFVIFLKGNFDNSFNDAKSKNVLLGVEKCDWRPPTNYGDCDIELGSYYDGEECVVLSGCFPSPKVIPFGVKPGIEECKILCEDATDSKTIELN